MLVIIISNLRVTEESREAEEVTETESSSIQSVKQMMNSNQSHSVGLRESVCGLERSCVHILYSLSLSESRNVCA